MSWSITASRSDRNRSGSTPGAPANAASAMPVATNSRDLNGVSSPTGTPLRVTRNDSPRSSPRMMSPLELRSSRCVIGRATSSVWHSCYTRAASHPDPGFGADGHKRCESRDELGHKSATGPHLNSAVNVGFFRPACTRRLQLCKGFEPPSAPARGGSFMRARASSVVTAREKGQPMSGVTRTAVSSRPAVAPVASDGQALGPSEVMSFDCDVERLATLDVDPDG